MAGESWGTPGSLHRRWQGRRPSCQRWVRGRVSPPSAVAQRAGVGCAAPPHVRMPWLVRAVPSPPVPHALPTGGRGAWHEDRGSLVRAPHQPRTPRVPLVWPGAAAQACRSRRGPVWGRSHRLRRAQASEVSLRRSLLSSSKRRCRSRAAGPRPARRAEPGGLWVDADGSRERAAGVPPACAGGEVHGVLSGVARRASPMGAGGGGHVPTVSRLRTRVSHVPRERGAQSQRALPCQARLPRAQGSGRCVCPGVSRRSGHPGASGDWAGRESRAQRGRTRACKRPPTASARASLRLLAAPEAWR